MPLLPRPWSLSCGGSGSAHSTCNWQSPKACLVLMSPVPGATTMAPSTVFHCAGPPFLLTHFERSLPSKRTMASEGGLPGASGVLAVPGVITGGTGRLRSETFQRVRPGSRGALWPATRTPVMSTSDARQVIKNIFRNVNETSFSSCADRNRLTSRKLSTSQHSEATQHDGTAVRGKVADPCGRHAADQNRKAAQSDHVGWPNADSHICHPRGWQTADQNGNRRRRQNRAAHVRHDARHHRTDMHIGHPGLRHSHVTPPRKSFYRPPGNLQTFGEHGPELLLRSFRFLGHDRQHHCSGHCFGGQELAWRHGRHVRRSHAPAAEKCAERRATGRLIQARGLSGGHRRAAILVIRLGYPL